jgi:hypothetical protein
MDVRMNPTQLTCDDTVDSGTNWIQLNSAQGPVDGINMARLSASIRQGDSLLLDIGWTPAGKTPWLTLQGENARRVTHWLAHRKPMREALDTRISLDTSDGAGDEIDMSQVTAFIWQGTLVMPYIGWTPEGTTPWLTLQGEHARRVIHWLAMRELIFV